MPIEISWEYMDTQLLQRFWSGHPHLQQGTADISERMLVFHRGVHTVRSSTNAPDDVAVAVMDEVKRLRFWPVHQHLLKVAVPFGT